MYQINVDSSGYIVLKNFHGDGANPESELTLCGTTLYGATSKGGAYGCGVLFSLSLAPPALFPSPTSQTAEAGSTAEFRVRVEGAEPLLCRWYFNGNLLSGCTNPVLSLPGVDASDTGIYTLTVSNFAGQVSTGDLPLSVIPAVEHTVFPAIKSSDLASVLAVECTSALAPSLAWTSIEPGSLAVAPPYYVHLTAPPAPQGYYRVLSSGQRQSLELAMMPAISLSGAVGETVRLDCIDRFGPPNAWTTLATIVLTNSHQLYFDISAIAQPPRLWRVVPLP